MRKIVLTFGLISGAIVSSMFMITMPLYKNGTLKMDSGELLGYTTMVIALSMIFFGVKSYRDRHLNGTITFGKAFQVGIYIALISALCYAVSWEFYLNLFYPDFMDHYTATLLENAKASGADPAKLQETIDKTNQMKELYKNPFLRFGLTLMEILPVGLIISLLTGAILRKKQILPA